MWIPKSMALIGEQCLFEVRRLLGKTVFLKMELCEFTTYL